MFHFRKNLVQPCITQFKIWLPPRAGVSTAAWAMGWVLARVKLGCCFPVKVGAQLCIGGVQPPTHYPQPRVPPCHVGGERRSAFPWSGGAAWSVVMPPPASTLQAVHPKKSLPITLLLSILNPGKVGQGVCHPFPSFPPSSPGSPKPCCAPRVHRAGLIRDVLMMNASSWNCGSCLSGMMQLRKNVKYLSWFTAGNSASN